MLLIRVQYKNGWYDYIVGQVLDEQIARKHIKQFYRPSEKRWVTVGVDRIRGIGGTYDGAERRRSHPITAILGTS
jgi:hypothetical protein